VKRTNACVPVRVWERMFAREAGGPVGNESLWKAIVTPSGRRGRSQTVGLLVVSAAATL